MRRATTPAALARDAAARERAGGSGRPGRSGGPGFGAGLALGVVLGLVLGVVLTLALALLPVRMSEVATPHGARSGAAAGTGAGEGARGDDDEPGSDAEVRPATRITLAFAGDIHFENHLAVLAEDPDSLSELADTLGAADLSMANLETAITERGTPIPGKPFTWRAPPGAFDAVAGAGIDVVTMANNHAVDYGDVGLSDTLEAIGDAPVAVIGIGEDEDAAFAPYVADVEGVRVAVLTGSQVWEETLANYSAGPSSPGIAYAAPRGRLERAVREARRDADVVVAYVHGGVEGATCPGDEAVATVRALERAGADIVLVDHAHRVNGAGWVGDAYAHFGLGNFVYYMSTEPASHTGVLTLTVDVPASDSPDAAPNRPDRPLVVEADWDAMLISGDGIPRRQDAATTQRLQRTFEAARACTPARATP